MSYEDKQEHTTAMKACKIFSPVRKSLYCQDCGLTESEHMLPPETPTALYAVAYRDLNYWHLAKYPWVQSHTAAEQQLRFLETSLHYKNLHLRIVKITFLEI